MKELRRSVFIITVFFLGVWCSDNQLPGWARIALPVAIIWWLIKYDEIAFKKRMRSINNVR